MCEPSTKTTKLFRTVRFPAQRQDHKMTSTAGAQQDALAFPPATAFGRRERLQPFARAATLLHTWFDGFADSVMNVGERAVDALRIQHRPSLGTQALDGKVCIVTGANAGIGEATSALLAQRGAHVIMACRSKERGQKAATALLRTVQPLPGCGSPTVEVMELDLASLASVRRFCNEFKARKLPLHLLVANAGVMSPATRHETEDGLEMQFQVNFLSHWLLATQLLGQQRELRAAAAAQSAQQKGGSSSSGFGLRDDGTRVVMVTSLTHRAGILNWHDKQSSSQYNPLTSYGLSKLANALTATELQRRITKAGGAWGNDSAVSVHPGVVDTHMTTNFFKNQGSAEMFPAARQFIARAVDTVAPVLLKSTLASAHIVGYAALAPPEQVGGRYVAHARVWEPAKEVKDAELGQELWDLAERLTGTSTHPSLRC